MMLADVEELSARLGQPLTIDTADYNRAKANIEDVSTLVLHESGQVWDPGNLPPVAKTIVLRASERAFRNPSGAISRTMGPFGEGYGQGNATGVYLTDEEKEILDSLATANAGGIICVGIDNPVYPYGVSLFAHDQFYPASTSFPYYAEGDFGVLGQ